MWITRTTCTDNKVRITRPPLLPITRPQFNLFFLFYNLSKGTFEILSQHAADTINVITLIGFYCTWTVLLYLFSIDAKVELFTILLDMVTLLALLY